MTGLRRRQRVLRGRGSGPCCQHVMNMPHRAILSQQGLAHVPLSLSQCLCSILSAPVPHTRRTTRTGLPPTWRSPRVELSCRSYADSKLVSRWSPQTRMGVAAALQRWQPSLCTSRAEKARFTRMPLWIMSRMGKIVLFQPNVIDSAAPKISGPVIQFIDSRVKPLSVIGTGRTNGIGSAPGWIKSCGSDRSRSAIVCPSC
jgi:hypothetical protein